MKVIIAGSREFNDPFLISYVRNQVDWVFDEIVCGMAKGVDSLAFQWAQDNSIPVAKFPADWKTHGKSAGYLRNLEMAKYADALIAIWDGKSKGTFNMIHQMVLANKPVYVYCPTD